MCECDGMFEEVFRCYGYGCAKGATYLGLEMGQTGSAEESFDALMKMKIAAA